MIPVGVDIGGSGIRVRLNDPDGVPRKARDRAPIAWREGGVDLVALSMRVSELVRDIAPGGSRYRIAIGMTGMPGLIDRPEELAAEIALRLDVDRVAISSDALTTHLGALGGEEGIVVAAGTGVIAIGTDHRSIWNQADGWGYLLGDEGGGAWIGASGLRAALRAQDRRDGGSEVMLELAVQRYGSVDRILQATYGAPSAANQVAQFAPLVAMAANEGDARASHIWAEAGRHLAEAAHAAARGLERRYSWGGRLFSAGSLLVEPFRSRLTALDPRADIVAPHGQAAEGALALAATPALRAPDRYLRVFEIDRAVD